MKDVLITSWVSCLYYYIYIWNNKCFCPGRMFVYRNPHPKVNKHHAMYFVDSRIMYGWELVEGRYWPKGLRSTYFKIGLGALTMELMWMMMKPL